MRLLLFLVVLGFVCLAPLWIKVILAIIFVGLIYGS